MRTRFNNLDRLANSANLYFELTFRRRRLRRSLSPSYIDLFHNGDRIRGLMLISLPNLATTSKFQKIFFFQNEGSRCQISINTKECKSGRQNLKFGDLASSRLRRVPQKDQKPYCVGMRSARFFSSFN